MLADNGADVDAVTQHEGYTILHVAATAGRVAVLRWAIRRGHDLSVRDALNHTALDVAISSRQHYATECLRKARHRQRKGKARTVR